MAASIDGEQPGRFGLLPQSGGPELPRLILITLAPLSAAYRIPAATFSSLPPMNGELPKITSQKLPRAFTGINLALNATPASSIPSLVSCPIVPLTCVPCPSKSSGGLTPGRGFGGGGGFPRDGRGGGGDRGGGGGFRGGGGFGAGGGN